MKTGEKDRKQTAGRHKRNWKEGVTAWVMGRLEVNRKGGEQQRSIVV